jgi:uncharacterized protein (DUF1501 family)
MPAWQDRQLALVHACGAPDESRSHFQAMELMERGVSDLRGPASGWIGRHLATLDTGNPSPLRAIGLGERTPRSLHGSVPVSALRSIADFHLGGDLKSAAWMQAALGSLYVGDDALGLVGQETLDILGTLEHLDPQGYRPAQGAAYPQSDFGIGLKQVAMLTKAEVGLEVAAIDLGGWDTHFAQGGAQGLMAGLLTDLGQGLAALHADLHEFSRNLTVVVMSEFGRRAGECQPGDGSRPGERHVRDGGNVVGGRTTPVARVGDDQLGPGDLAATVDTAACCRDPSA